MYTQSFTVSDASQGKPAPASAVTEDAERQRAFDAKIDCDGRIGGYNFQWCWSSGFVAGQWV